MGDIVLLAFIAISVIFICKVVLENMYDKLEAEILCKLGVSGWYEVSDIEATVTVKSRQALDKYDTIRYLKDNPQVLPRVERILKNYAEIAESLQDFLVDNEYTGRLMYSGIEKQIRIMLGNTAAYRVQIKYVSSAGNYLANKTISITKHDISRIRQNPALLMSKTEYNKYLREQQKADLEQKHHVFYERVNAVIDIANANRDILVIKDSVDQLDRLIAQLFDRTVNSIKKIKSIDSEEWDVIANFISQIKQDVDEIVGSNRKILKYYESPAFYIVKEKCDVLMNSQREFNEYISEKVQSITELFGKKVVRNETVYNDENNYIRPYKKTLTPFTAEVSAQVFASAENNPLAYVVKQFYPNKSSYPLQIQKLHLLLEELETLQEAKQIIDKNKKEYQQYLGDVPDFILEHDETGFYSRLGFANIDESVLTVEYRFSYTSSGGMAQRVFSVPMTEATIVELIRMLESKLTEKAFAKEQRNLMTAKLRTIIKTRDNFTCCNCGNSTHTEPNLLLEIDHIVPVAKGGCTVPENLQTLCWKCNRAKGDKILA